MNFSLCVYYQVKHDLKQLQNCIVTSTYKAAADTSDSLLTNTLDTWSREQRDNATLKPQSEVNELKTPHSSLRAQHGQPQ